MMAMTYKPRSGALRKVKYPLSIYRESEIPTADLGEVMSMRGTIKAEERSANVAYNEREKKDMILKSAKLELSENEKTCSGKLDKTSKLPQPMFSNVEVDLYKPVYDSMPPFPIASFEDTLSNGESDDCAADSDYDMDTEDEEWLDKHKDYLITPSRLEYIFSKLNKRNTHVPEKAIGALSETFHADFHLVFPYWKGKRLQNKNVSSFRPKSLKITSKKDLGLVSKDPYVIFYGKARKSQPALHTPLNVTHKQEQTKELDRILKLRDRLLALRSWTSQAIPKCLQERAAVKDKIQNFVQTAISSENVDDIDQENDTGYESEIAEQTIAKRSTVDDGKHTGQSYFKNSAILQDLPKSSVQTGSKFNFSAFPHNKMKTHAPSRNKICKHKPCKKRGKTQIPTLKPIFENISGQVEKLNLSENSFAKNFKPKKLPQLKLREP